MVDDLLASIQDMYQDILLRPSTFLLYDLKWSIATGHLVKVVKLPIEVIHDSKEEKAVYP